MLRRAICLRFFALRAGVAAIALMFIAAGCQPTDALTAKISADDSTEFFRWRRDVGSQLSPAQQQQLETTVQEVRLDVMFRQEASGHDAIEAAVCRRLNHLVVKDALLLGAQLKWRRLAGEREDLQRVTNANSHLITKPGDQMAAADLDQYRGKHQQRLEATIRDLKAVEQEITALGGQIPTLELATPATAPVAVSHAEALKQMADMLEGRRTGAMFKYGEWPVKIDWEGKQLDGDKRAEFLAKQAASARAEKVIIPVRIKGRWLLFESADQAPALPEDVRATLTAAEVAAFKHDWLELEAERWARQIGKELPDPAPEADR